MHVCIHVCMYVYVTTCGPNVKSGLFSWTDRVADCSHSQAWPHPRSIPLTTKIQLILIIFQFLKLTQI